MEEAAPSLEAATAKSDDNLHRWAMLAGLLLAFSEMLVRLFSGKDVVDAIWPHAVRSLEWTMTLRASPILTLTLFVGAGLAGYGLRTAVSKGRGQRRWLLLPYGGLGLLLGLICLHLLMDVFYLRGAFLLLPTLMGWTLACLLIALGGPPTLRYPGEQRMAASRVIHMVGVFFAAWLVMPGIPAVIGYAPTPPDAPAMGYGSFPGPYTVEQYRFPFEFPEEVMAVQGNLEDDVDWSVYITLPELPDDSPVTHVPLAILLHGFSLPRHRCLSGLDHTSDCQRDGSGLHPVPLGSSA